MKSAYLRTYLLITLLIVAAYLTYLTDNNNIIINSLKTGSTVYIVHCPLAS